MRLWNRTRLVSLSLLLLIGETSQLAAQEENFPYALRKSDYLILPLGTAAVYLSDLLGDGRDQNLTVQEIEALDRTDVNWLDRGATDNRNRAADAVGDIFYKAFPILPVAVLLPQAIDGEWGNLLSLGVMYYETYALTKGITNLTKAFVPRSRPYLYNDACTAEERFSLQGNEAPEGKTSFFSGHASTAFAAAVFLSTIFTDIYGAGVWSNVVWASSLTAASVTAYCRVLAGEHFLSDVLVGALVGSAIGYAVPVMHKTGSAREDSDASVMVLPNSISFVWRY